MKRLAICKLREVGASSLFLHFVFLTALWLTLVGSAYGQVKTVFSGVPSQKISEAGIDRRVEAITRQLAVNLRCVVSEIDGKFYWASRDNKELIRHRGGSFVTYIAVDGSGYIRIIDPSHKATAPAMSSTEAKFDYVEHLLLGLRSVTYHGNSQ
jgi:hypothetical protein